MPRLYTYMYVHQFTSGLAALYTFTVYAPCLINLEFTLKCHKGNVISIKHSLQTIVPVYLWVNIIGEML